MAYAETVDYQVLRPAKVSTLQHFNLSGLLRESLQADFPDRSAAQVDSLARDLLTPTGSARQSYAHPSHVFATEQQVRMVGHVHAINTATSMEVPGVPGFLADAVGMGIRQAYLHVPAVKGHGEQLVKNRTLLLGQFCLGAAARADVAEAGRSGRASVLDGLLLAAAAGRNPLQPVKVNLYQGEQCLRGGLEAAGFRQVDGSRIQVTAFGAGPGVQGVGQDVWLADSVQMVQAHIAAKLGADDMRTKIQS